MTTNDYRRLPMTTDDYQWLSNDSPMTIPWLSHDYPMTIRWLSDDYPMTIRWLSNDYLMTIWWLSDDFPMTIQWLSWTFDLFFLMIIDLKRSIHRRWLFKSGATFNLRWSCLANWLNFLWRTAESRELQIIIIYSCANFQTVSPKLLTADENCWQTVWRCQDIAIYWGGDNYRVFFLLVS